MIIIKLKGGLGNQLFQYATGRALAEERKEMLLLDLSYLSQNPKGAYTKRVFELDQIKYIAQIADPTQIKKFSSRRFLSRILNRTRIKSEFTFNESTSGYMPDIHQLPVNVLLDGYWQTDKYFNSIRVSLLNEIQPSIKFTDKGKIYAENIKKSNSVSIHVRRGDYIHHKKANEYHVICGLDYYKKAIEILESSYIDLHYYIFSDDIEWCKIKFDFLKKVEFIIDENDKKSSQDLFLMSYCKHNIIANSSYSWWAAWLNINREKIVVAPEIWFKKSNVQSPDLLPESWIKIK